MTVEASIAKNQKISKGGGGDVIEQKLYLSELEEFYN